MITKTSLHFGLTVVIVSLSLIAACTAKLQRRSNESDNATTSTNPTAPIASAKAEERIDTTLTLEKLIRKDYPRSSVLTNEYNLDTAITNHLPHFNALELFTYYRFLFDLAKEDSMYCPRCNDTSYLNSKDRPDFEYYHYYKGIPVQNRYIALQTDGHLNIERIDVGYKRIKYADVIPQKSVAEAAKKAAEELIMAQSLERAERGKLFGPPYNGADLVSYYRGLKIIPREEGVLVGADYILAHIFEWRTWSVAVYDKTSVTTSRNNVEHLCETCNFSKATYTTCCACGGSYPNSTVISHWFYLLSQGGSGTNDNGCDYDLIGVGLETATKIADQTLTEKVEETETMAMFANSAISAAVDIANDNACDPIVVQTAKALSAVGLSPTNCSCPNYTPCAANHSKLPRIDMVTVSDDDDIIYMSQKVVWKNENGVAKLCFEHQQNKLPIPAGANITISVTTSEKMANLNFVGFKNGATTYNASSDTWALAAVQPQSPTGDGTVWSFALIGVNLPSSPTTPYQLLFTGTDMQGDALERMQEYSGFPCNINYNQIPVYNGSGWSPAAKPASTTTPHAVFEVLIADCSSSPETDLCDNHLPYLRKMHAQDGGSVAAEQEWILTDNNLCLTDSYPDGYTDFVNDLDITITASEPLAELHLHALSLGNLYYDLSNTTYFSVTTPNSIDGGITWTMTMHQNEPIISNAYSPDNVYLLHFSGSDLAGNPLEVMQNYTSYDATDKCMAVSDMPFRTADGGWTSSSAGIDNAFWLNIDYCPNWSFDVLFNAGMGITLSSTPSNTIASWELVDNETGLSTSHTLANANDNIAYYFDETSFALPEDFTLRVTNTSGCTKVIELTTPTANCSKPNINALVNSISTAGNQSILSSSSI